MFALGPLELLVILVLLVLVVGLVVGAVTRAARLDADLDAQVARAQRHQGWAARLALAAALVMLPLAQAAAGALGDATVLPVLPALMAAVACVVLWVGEATFPRPTGTVRSTVLNERSLSDVLPRGWLRTAFVLGAIDVVIFVAGAMTASGGTSVRWDQGGETASPYPGLGYVVPQLIALVVASVLAWLVCRAVMSRATIASDLASDAVLRRASAGRVLRWLCWGLCATAAGDLLVAGDTVRTVAPESWQALGTILTVLGTVALLAAMAIAFVPVPRLPRERPADRSVETGALRAG
jgi:hypothetical protein